jgi:hypothetical protein
MQDELGLPELTPSQKRSTAILKVLFRTAIVTFVCLGILTCYYGLACPATANIESGNVYPFFDKIYGRYVFLTRSEYYAPDVLVSIGVVCVFVYVLIDLELKRQLRAARKGQYP